MRGYNEKIFFVITLLCIIFITGCIGYQETSIGYESAEVSSKTIKETEEESKNKVNSSSPSNSDNSNSVKQSEKIKINIEIGNQKFITNLYDNASAAAFASKLPLIVEMNELNGNEKYIFLNEDFPTDEEYYRQINKGDLMLYGNSYLVLFYESFPTSYDYTRIGYIENANELSQVIGKDNVKVTFSLN